MVMHSHPRRHGFPDRPPMRSMNRLETSGLAVALLLDPQKPSPFVPGNVVDHIRTTGSQPSVGIMVSANEKEVPV